MAWPTWSPASSTIGCRPRSSTCAAAARPTGPAPMIATVLASLMLSSHKTRNIEIMVKKHGPLCRRLGIRGFGAFSATFRNQKSHQLPHHFVVGVADQRGRIAHLRYTADHQQRLDVMGEGGGRDLQFLLQAPNRQPGS